MSDAPRAPERPAGDAWQVRLPAFQGPIEILLHLVRIREIDPAGVCVLEVARQYAAWIDLVGDPDVERAGEYLVLAATLVHMKSRHLLPPDPADPLTEEGTPPDEGGDPHATHGMRRAAEHLQEREARMELIYSRPADSVAEYAGEQGIEADLSALLRAFQAILKRVGSDPTSRLTRDRITLVERIHWLLETLQRERRVGFRALFRDVTDRMSCILTFLALLELIRLRLARAFESHHEDDLMILLADETAASAPEEEPHA